MDAVISGLLRFSAPTKVQLTETNINEVIKEVEKLISGVNWCETY